ncbi:MAG: helix-turn-helix domain-containing protein [Candidatus Thorarchaeota archaeon]|jgi:predicted transcriptional regulator
MVQSSNVELLKTLASDTRLGIIQLLLSKPDGHRFNEIAKALDILPSTLEAHVKRLLDHEMIAHIENRYVANINTEITLWILNALSPISDEPYFSTHKMTIEERQLRTRFHTLNYEVYNDLLSILTKAKDTFSEGIEMGFLGGSMDMQLEQGFFDLWKPSFKHTSVEAVFTREGIEDLKNLEHPERFIDAVNPSKTKVFLVEKCDFAIGGCERGGFLFLPKPGAEVDFNSCLCFEDSEGAKWLKDVFDALKAQSFEITIEDLMA